EGIKVGIKEGVQQGKALILVKQICTKLQKSQSVEQIADALEEDPETIVRIIAIANEYAPNYDMEAIAKRCMQEIHLSTCR
ncbi:MAG: hypothetical protein Q4D54_02270, partial [Eubacteriales bacterium]|nr:hypothetical protein [Eubacteriales bacterium]